MVGGRWSVVGAWGVRWPEYDDDNGDLSVGLFWLRGGG